MGEPRYQVFVSATYLDLKDARQAVLHQLLHLNCIPAGMEFFAASSQEQFDYIKGIVDQSDYYILILGWRYGSVHSDKVSFTEREFDYAVSKGIPVLIFFHDDESTVPADYREADADKRNRLAAFRDKALKGRMAKPWHSAEQLAIEAMKSLQGEMRTNRRVGWIRADSGPDKDTLQRIVDIQTENRTLRAERDELRASFPRASVDDLANFSDGTIQVDYYWKFRSHENEYHARATRTWQDIFTIIAPMLVGTRHENEVSERIAKAHYAQDPNKAEPVRFWIDTLDLEQIAVQFQAYGLVNVSRLQSAVGYQTYWTLTPAGEQAKLKYCSVKRQ